MQEEGRIQLMFVGLTRSGKGDELYGQWVEADELPNNGQEIDLDEVKIRCYGLDDGKRKKWVPMCGQIYSFKIGGNEGSIAYGNRKYVGTWENGQQRTEWQILSRTLEQTFEAEQKGSKLKLDLSPLDPIRNAYGRAIGVQKSLILTEAVKYITGHRPKD